ncbi:MAG: RNA polymerase sigma factor [Planctomycetota bacterium]
MVEFSTDTELMQKAIHGDRLALERLLVRHQPALIRLIQAEMGVKLQAHITAEDLFQQSCVEVLRCLHHLEIHDDQSFFRWLSAIAHHRVLDAAKASSIRERTVPKVTQNLEFESTDDLFQQISASISTASHQLHRQELEAAIRQAVASLEHPLQRRAVTLRYLEGLSLEETARLMNITIDSVRAHLHRAKDPLVVHLDSFRKWIS